MANEHDLHPQTYHCRLVQEEIFVLADHDAADNTHDGIKVTGSTDLEGTPPMSAVRVPSECYRTCFISNVQIHRSAEMKESYPLEER
jgi:hypothetical protein